MIKNLFFLIFVFLFLNSKGQGSAGFFNDQNFFYGYQNGQIAQLEYIKIDTFFSSPNYIAYIDNRGNFKLYTQNQVYTIFPVPPNSVKVSNYLMAYMQGGQLGVFNGKSSKKVETFTNGVYHLGDSIIGYVDNFNFLKAYVYDTVFELMPWSGEPFTVSDNMMAFQYQNSQFNVFYNKHVYELENYLPKDYKIGRNILAYNNYMGYFKVFQYGETFELESYDIHQYETGNELVSYNNNIGEWIVFENGEKHTLMTTNPKKKWIKRNMIAYVDGADRFFVYKNGKTILLENFMPKKVEIWDDMVVYSDLYGTIYGYVNGKKTQLSSSIAIDWQLQNGCIVYLDQTPALKTVWNQFKEYKYNPNEDPIRIRK